MKQAGRPQNTPEVLWSKVDVKHPDECWPWKGFVSESGYGRTWINDVGYYAHRVIFNLANPGMIELKAPTNKKAKGFLMHLCDNRICCNPAHLKVADLRENNLDMHQKGRVKHKSGGDHHRSVFTNEQIAQIMDMRNNGKTMRQIAMYFDANLSTVKSLIRRMTYA
jgi:Zinc-binding loop region of homing endonuclease